MNERKQFFFVFIPKFKKIIKDKNLSRCMNPSINGLYFSKFIAYKNVNFKSIAPMYAHVNVNNSSNYCEPFFWILCLLVKVLCIVVGLAHIIKCAYLLGNCRKINIYKRQTKRESQEKEKLLNSASKYVQGFFFLFFFFAEHVP